MSEAWPNGRTGRAAAIAFVVLVVFGVLAGLFIARTAVLIAFLAVVVATVLCYPIDWLSRRMPRPFAVLVVLVVVIALIAGVGALGARRVMAQARQLPDAISAAQERLEHWSEQAGAPAAVSKTVKTQAPAAAAHALPIAISAVEVLSGAIVLFVLSFFLAAGRDPLIAGVRRLVPPAHESVFDEWLRRVGTTLQHWAGGIFVSMIIMGTLTATGLAIVGIKGWFVLGVITFFGTFVPYAGAIASAIPGLAVALSQGPRPFLYALGVYVVIHHIEGYVVQPIIMRRAVEIQPALLLFWDACLFYVFGVEGVMVATPLLACVQVSVEYLWIERKLGRATPPPSSRSSPRGG